MAVNFERTFGKNSAPAAPAADARPKSQLWLNIGYSSDVIDEETGVARFVSLPVGIPLDTQDKLPTNSRNKEYAAFQAARNDLMDQLMEVSKSLAPGEERILNLEIQLRRVNDEAEEVPADQNVFVKKLAL